MRKKHVIGPNGRRLTIADLPSPNTTRWVVRRKAEVVAAVDGGLISLEEACRRYALNFEEFRSWQRCIDCFGVDGLRTTWTQYYFSHKGFYTNPKWKRLGSADYHDFRVAGPSNPVSLMRKAKKTRISGDRERSRNDCATSQHKRPGSGTVGGGVLPL